MTDDVERVARAICYSLNCSPAPGEPPGLDPCGQAQECRVHVNGLHDNGTMDAALAALAAMPQPGVRAETSEAQATPDEAERQRTLLRHEGNIRASAFRAGLERALGIVEVKKQDGWPFEYRAACQQIIDAIRAEMAFWPDTPDETAPVCGDPGYICAACSMGIDTTQTPGCGCPLPRTKPDETAALRGEVETLRAALAKSEAMRKAAVHTGEA